MRKQTSLTLAIGLAFPAVTSLVACHTADSKAVTVPSAKVATAQRGDISHVLTLAGQFQPYQVVDVHPKVSGYMKRINVDIGDIVHQGETLAVLEVPELKAQLQQTVFQLKQSKEEITRRSMKSIAPRRNTRRCMRIGAAAAGGRRRPGLIAQQELDDAQAKDLSSQAQVDAAKSAMAAAQQHAEAAQQTMSAFRRWKTTPTSPRLSLAS